MNFNGYHDGMVNGSARFYDGWAYTVWNAGRHQSPSVDVTVVRQMGDQRKRQFALQVGILGAVDPRMLHRTS